MRAKSSKERERITDFEYITALTAVLIGLAVADMATSLHKLLRHRRRVKWDWVAPLAALVILVELFGLWWNWRRFDGNTIAEIAPYFLLLVLMFLAASVTLPDEVPEDGLDLGTYFDDTRGYFWTVYGTYVTIWIGMWTVEAISEGKGFLDLLRAFSFDYPWIAAAFTLVFVRARWASGLLLVVTLLWLLFEFDWWSRPLGSVG
jgi:hypothetical protein